MFTVPIPQYTRSKAEKILEYIHRGEPYGIYGIYDGGQGYIFTALSTSKKSSERNIVYYNAQNAGHLELLQLLGFTQDITYVNQFEQSNFFKNGLTLVILLPHTSFLSEETEYLLSVLRTSFPWKFSHAFLGYTNIFTIATARQKALYLKNWDYMGVLDTPSMYEVVKIYEDFYNKTITPEQKNLVITYSGGNSGLAKALFHQVTKSEFSGEFSLQDNDLDNRLTRILETLTDHELIQLISPTNKLTVQKLKDAGYITYTNELFTPLLPEFIKSSSYVAKRLLREKLPPQQKLLFNWFSDHTGELLTRQALAKLLWSDHSARKYSDWAIDKLVSDFRKAVQGYLTVKTIKRSGFISE